MIDIKTLDTPQILIDTAVPKYGQEWWDMEAERDFQRFNSNEDGGVANSPEYWCQHIFKHLYQMDTKDKTVLDIGCGMGIYLPILAGLFKETYALEFHEKRLDFAKDFVSKHSNQDITFIHDKARPGLLNEKVDVITSMAVFTHLGWNDKALFLDCVKDCLKPGGVAILTEGWIIEQPSTIEDCDAIYKNAILKHGGGGLIPISQQAIIDHMLPMTTTFTGYSQPADLDGWGTSSYIIIKN